MVQLLSTFIVITHLTFLPLVAGPAAPAFVHRVTGCVLPEWGCTQDKGEQVNLSNDGSGLLNGVYGCFQPEKGCVRGSDRDVSLYEDGSAVILYNTAMPPTP